MFRKVQRVYPMKSQNLTDGLFPNALPVLCSRQVFFEAIFGALWAPRRPQDAPGRSKALQDGPKTPPRGPKRRPDPPRIPKIPSKWSQVGTKIEPRSTGILKISKFVKSCSRYSGGLIFWRSGGPFSKVKSMVFGVDFQGV